MTDALVEAVARAVCRANCPPAMSEDAVECQTEGAWDMWSAEATAALQAIEAAGYLVVPSWQGMDSAPKDGTKILVSWKAGHVSIVWWQKYGNGSFTTGGSDRCGTPDQYDESWFLGWQPLPAAMLSAAPRVGEG